MSIRLLLPSAVLWLCSCTCAKPYDECIPTTCEANAFDCGPVSDGCNHVLNCGTCAAGSVCGAVEANRCGALPCVPSTCAASRAECGTVPDGCGGALTCGACPAPHVCGAPGAPNTCVPPACVPKGCAELGATCGAVDDGCGTLLSCGECAPPALSASRLPSGSVQLTWSWNGTAVLFELERSADGFPFALLANHAGTARQAPDLAAPTGPASYRVRAVDAHGPGAWSNVVVVSAVQVVSNAWPTLGGNIAHTGYNALETGLQPVTLSWSIATTTTASPIVTEGNRAYFNSGAGFSSPNSLLAVDIADGGLAWSHAFPRAYSVGQPAIFDGQINVAEVAGEAGTRLWSLDRAGGSSFSVPLTEQLDRHWAPLRLGDVVYTTTGLNGGLAGFDARSGASRFINLAIESYDEWSPASDGTLIYTFVAGNLRAHDPNTGVVLWKTSVPWRWNGWSMQTAPVLADGVAFVIAPPALHAIDLSTHAVRWSVNDLAFTGMPAVANGVVYAVSGGIVRAHDAQTGASLWTFAGDHKLSYPPVLTATHLFVASDNNAYAVDLASHAQAWHTTGGGWLSVAAGNLFVAGKPIQVWSLVTPPPPDAGASLCFADDAGWPGEQELVVAEHGTELATGFSNASAIAVSDPDLYFTLDGGAGAVLTMPTSGGVPTPMGVGQFEQTDLAVDHDNVYWAVPGLVLAVPRDGGWPTWLGVSFAPYAIAVDQGWVFWSETRVDGAVFAAPLSGGPTIELASPHRYAGPLAIDSSSVYWATQSTLSGMPRGSIMRVSRTGGSASMIAAGTFTVGDLKVDENNLYWTDRALSGAIWTMPRAGGTPHVLASNQHLISGLALDGPWVYWSTSGPCGGVKKMPRTGGTLTVLASEAQMPAGHSSLAVDATHVYWTTGLDRGSVRRAPK